MKRLMKSLPLICALPILAACSTTKPVEVKEVVIVPPVEQTCYPIASLKKVVVPAVVKTGFSIVSIESPPEYVYDERTGKTTVIQNPPIERREPWSKVVEPEKIYYTTQEGATVTDICEKDQVEGDPAIEAQPIDPTPTTEPEGQTVGTFRLIPSK